MVQRDPGCGSLRREILSSRRSRGGREEPRQMIIMNEDADPFSDKFPSRCRSRTAKDDSKRLSSVIRLKVSTIAAKIFADMVSPAPSSKFRDVELRSCRGRLQKIEPGSLRRAVNRLDSTQNQLRSIDSETWRKCDTVDALKSTRKGSGRPRKSRKTSMLWKCLRKRRVIYFPYQWK